MKPPFISGIHALAFFNAVLLATASAETVSIANSSQTAPGGNGTFSTFNVPSLSNSGQVAFLTFLSGTSGGATDYAGLFRGNGSGLLQIVRKGQTAPDVNGTFSVFKDPALNNNDVSAFLTQLAGTAGGTSDDWGIFMGDGVGDPVRVVREGQSAPDNDGVFSFFEEFFAFNDADQVAFLGYVDVGNGGSALDYDGIFRGDGTGVPVQIARDGQAAPSGNGNYSYFFDVALNESGQVAFLSTLSGTSGGANDNDGVFRGDGTNPTVTIVREDDPVADGNGEFFRFSHPRINDAGEVAFWANIRNTTSSGTDDLGIFRGDGISGPVKIVRRYETVPGETNTFNLFGIQSLNNAGQVAVTAEIDLHDGGGTGDESALIIGDGTPGSLTVIAREGQTIPGGTETFIGFSNPGLNNAGQVVFRAFVTKPSFGNNLGLYFYDPTEGLFQICLEGAPFLGSTLDTFILFDSGGYNSDGRTGLNDVGEVAFQFQLDNGKRGIARWSTAPGPVIPFQITKLEIEPDPYAPMYFPTRLRLEWTAPVEASSFNIRYSSDLSLPTASWPLFAGPIPRDEPLTSYETYIDPYFLPTKLFFIVEHLE